MLLSLTKSDLENIIFKVSGTSPDELSLLEAISPFCDQQDIKNAKILFLAGCSREFRINGVSFDDRQKIIKGINEKDIIHFEPEPENEYDPNAIRVMFENQLIGYLPKRIAALLQDCIEDLCGEVNKVVGNEQEAPGDSQNKDETKFLGVRFIFRRKGSVDKKQVVNLDTVELILEDYLGTPKEFVAQAQFFSILDGATDEEYHEQEPCSTVEKKKELQKDKAILPPIQPKEQARDGEVKAAEETKKQLAPVSIPQERKNKASSEETEEDIF